MWNVFNTFCVDGPVLSAAQIQKCLPLDLRNLCAQETRSHGYKQCDILGDWLFFRKDKKGKEEDVYMMKCFQVQ